MMPKYKPLVQTSPLNSMHVYLKTSLKSELRYLTCTSNMSKIKILILTSTKFIPPLVFLPLANGLHCTLISKTHRESSLILILPLYIKYIIRSLSILNHSFPSATTMVQTSLKSPNSLLSCLLFHYFPPLIHSLHKSLK